MPQNSSMDKRRAFNDWVENEVVKAAKENGMSKNAFLIAAGVDVPRYGKYKKRGMPHSETQIRALGGYDFFPYSYEQIAAKKVEYLFPEAQKSIQLTARQGINNQEAIQLAAQAGVPLSEKVQNFIKEVYNHPSPEREQIMEKVVQAFNKGQINE